jgi:uncharacterized alpha-E superfamily protein
VLGTNLLKSVSGFQMYRQYCHPQVEMRRIVAFLVQDEQFPRAIACAVNRARRSCGKLPRCEAALASLDRVHELLAEDPRKQLDADSVTRVMDRIQLRLGEAHQAVAQTWFLGAGGDQ